MRFRTRCSCSPSDFYWKWPGCSDMDGSLWQRYPNHIIHNHCKGLYRSVHRGTNWLWRLWFSNCFWLKMFDTFEHFNCKFFQSSAWRQYRCYYHCFKSIWRFKSIGDWLRCKYCIRARCSDSIWKWTADYHGNPNRIKVGKWSLQWRKANNWLQNLLRLVNQWLGIACRWCIFEILHNELDYSNQGQNLQVQSLSSVKRGLFWFLKRNFNISSLNPIATAATINLDQRLQRSDRLDPTRQRWFPTNLVYGESTHEWWFHIRPSIVFTNKRRCLGLHKLLCPNHSTHIDSILSALGNINLGQNYSFKSVRRINRIRWGQWRCCYIDSARCSSQFSR